MHRYAAWTVGGIALTGILMGTAPKAIADTPGATNYQDPPSYPSSWPTVWNPYTVNGVGILDPTGNADGTKGAQPAQSGDIAPCSGGSVFFSRDTSNLYFRLCVDADPYVSTASSGPYVASGSWALLIDVNGDGFREFAVFLDGKQGQGYDLTPDNLYVVYKSNLNQGFTSDDLELSSGSGSTIPGNAVLWVQDSAIGSPIRQTTVDGETGWPTLGRDLSRTRSVDRGDGTYYLDIQVPLAALDATQKGGPRVTFSTPVSFVFSTANSNTDPYQKDIVMPGTFSPTATVPLPFGDIVTGNTTYPQPAIPTVTAGTCSATNTLSATVIDSLSITSSTTVGTSLTSVKFFYQFDSDGDGLPAPSGTWTFLGNGSLPATTPATTNPWSVTWNSTLLPSGQYFIKAVAVDNGSYTTDSVDAIDDAGANTAAGGDTFNPGTLQSTPVSPVFASVSNTCGTKAADVLLLKRITAINGSTTNPNDNTTSLTGVLIDPNWKAGYVIGATDGGKVKPGDTIEYTIYYLNNGGRNAKSVRICDRLNANQTFYPDTYPNSTFIQNNTTNPNSPGSGMQVQKGTSAALTLTNTSDSDGGQFIAATGTALPTNCNSVSGAPNNDYGALILDLVTSPGSPNLTVLPGKTGQGSPNDSFGLWRFITKVNKVSP